jgi:hypothetical protein
MTRCSRFTDEHKKKDRETLQHQERIELDKVVKELGLQPLALLLNQQLEMEMKILDQGQPLNWR